MVVYFRADSMSTDAQKGHSALRRGRYSLARAEYFLTVCTANRRAGLTTPNVATALLKEACAMAEDATWTLRCAVVMPDHAHLLVLLGERLSLGRTIQRLKAKTSSVLCSADLEWERGFFDHRLRPDDERLPVFRYIYLNPYRADLLPNPKRFPYYYCQDSDWIWFSELVGKEAPAPEWLP